MPEPLILSGSRPRPAGWVTIRRRRDGLLMHTPAWAWERLAKDTEVADLVVSSGDQLPLFGRGV